MNAKEWAAERAELVQDCHVARLATSGAKANVLAATSIQANAQALFLAAQRQERRADNALARHNTIRPEADRG